MHKGNKKSKSVFIIGLIIIYIQMQFSRYI